VEKIFDGPYASLALEGEVLWFVRKPVPTGSAESAREGLVAMGQRIAELKVAPRTLVLDTRAAPGRNDDEFESSVVPLARRFSERFERTAILVATPIGRLQAQRLGRELAWSAVVFVDEAEAIAWSHSREKRP
jgi:hypothetical protein